MEPHIAVLEERFRNIIIDGRPFEFMKYPERSDTKVLMDTILDYD